jgi:hypothetical protein
MLSHELAFIEVIDRFFFAFIIGQDQVFEKVRWFTIGDSFS